jgi:hypothetical protein
MPTLIMFTQRGDRAGTRPSIERAAVIDRGRERDCGESRVRNCRCEPARPNAVSPGFKETNLVHAPIKFLLATLAAVMLVASADAQQAITPYVHQTSLFFAEDVDALERAAGLSTEQRKGAEQIMLEASRTFALKLALERRQTQQMWADGIESRLPEDKQAEARAELQARIAVVHAQSTKERATIETDALAKLMGLLTPVQISGDPAAANTSVSHEGWAGFERRRRLSIVEHEQVGPSIESPRLMLRLVRLDQSDIEAALPVLDSYERKLDPIIRQRMKIVDQFRDHILAGEQLKPEDQASFYYPMINEISVLRIETFGRLVRAVSAQGADLLWRQRLGGGWSRAFYPPATHSFAFDAFKKMQSLRPEQRAAAEDLIAAADADAMKDFIRHTEDGDRALVAGEPLEKQAELSRTFQAATQQLQSKTQRTIDEQLRSLLDDSQREEYELCLLGTESQLKALPTLQGLIYGSKLVPKDRRLADPIPD